MFTNQDIIAIVFRLINFIALIGIGFFVFKKYIMPDLLLSLTRKKENQDFLFAQQAALEKQQLNLDALLKEDSVMCQEFRTKIDVWKKAVALESERHEKEQINTMAMVNKRRAHNAAQHQQKQIQNSVTHAVVIKLEKSLSLYFKNEKHNDEYLSAIVRFMDERTL
ncbi:MAG TPA: hypothetical protein VKR54_04575 [Candidatus Babeliales bacterium]|jgi:hypothetical protein|nr:hypothetical protein [Candidatus Babeliales bacterium]